MTKSKNKDAPVEVKIRDLKADPSKYVRKTVVVSGHILALAINKYADHIGFELQETIPGTATLELLQRRSIAVRMASDNTDKAVFERAVSELKANGEVEVTGPLVSTEGGDILYISAKDFRPLIRKE